MKIIKRILIALVAIVALLLVVALFSKKQYAVESEVVIQKPKQEVYDYIKYLKNQDNYSKWAKMDLNSKKTYTGTDATVGFVSAWASEKDDVGKGEQEIKNIVEGERIVYELRFIEPFPGVAKAYMTTEALTPATTKVKWGFESEMPYPMNLMLLCMDMEKMIRDDLSIGLGNLKVILEK